MSTRALSSGQGAAALFCVIALVSFAVYQSYALLVLLVGGGSTLVLPLGVAMQAIGAVFAAIGIARGGSWVSMALAIMAASAIVTSLYEAFGLGIVPWLDALLYSAIVSIGALLCFWCSQRGHVS